MTRRVQTLEIRASSRFSADFRRASGPLQSAATREVQLLQRRALAEREWVRRYDRVAGIRDHVVIELELGGGPRLLAGVVGSTVTLLALGGHEVVTAYRRRRSALRDIRSAEPASPDFLLGANDPFFPTARSGAPRRLTRWWPEVSPEWLYFLDDEQAAVCQGAVDAIESVLLQDGYYTVQLIVGGPGTGKSSILLQLLRRLSCLVEAGSETWQVGLSVSDRMADFIAAATGWDLTETRSLAEHEEGPDVLLVDDPTSVYEIGQAADRARHANVKAVVVAFDPLQLAESMSDSEYAALRKMHNANEFRLGTCYRQKEEVGKVALNVANVVAASSPFLDDGKKHRYSTERERLTALSNALVFTNPSGFASTYPDATLEDWRSHIGWVTRQSPHSPSWPPLLVVTDDDTNLPRNWIAALHGIRHERIALSEIQSRIKGLEYQHVAVVLSDERYVAIQNGFSGTGRRLYNDYRLLRIPFTRARDSLAIFVR